MIEKTRYYILPQPIQNEQKTNPLTRSLHLCETGELIIPQGDYWARDEKSLNCLLLYCTKGEGSLVISRESVFFKENQFYIIPAGMKFKLLNKSQKPMRLLAAWFSGENTRYLEKEFSNVRNVIPSVRNLVANRDMLFDEIFNNLARGFHDENLEYINYCFGHLLATFIYGYKTSETDEEEPGHMVRRAIQFFENNLNKRLTLVRIATEVGYSPTYFSTIFRRETGYSPVSYFSHLKIVKACEYLDQTSSKVKQISFLLGYADPYYFTRDFKLKMGLSPRQYRNRTSRRILNPDSVQVIEKA